MTIQYFDPKEQQAIDVALCLTDSEDTFVTVDDVVGWDKEKIYEWLEDSGYAWTGKEWILKKGDDHAQPIP